MKREDEGGEPFDVVVCEEWQRHFPADFIISTKSSRYCSVRFKTHKQVLWRGSAYFREMLRERTPAKEDKSEQQHDALEVLPLEERSGFVHVLLESLYENAAKFGERMAKMESENTEKHLR